MSASPLFIQGVSHDATRPIQNHWIERRDYSVVELAPIQRERSSRYYSDEPPLNWTSHSHGIQLEGPAFRKLAYFRSLSSIDETEIPGPAVPVWRNQLNRPYDRLVCQPFGRMRFA